MTLKQIAEEFSLSYSSLAKSRIKHRDIFPQAKGLSDYKRGKEYKYEPNEVLSFYEEFKKGALKDKPNCFWKLDDAALDDADEEVEYIQKNTADLFVSILSCYGK